MATLYVENVPEDLYEALRARARQHRKSIAAEVLALLTENIPTNEELKRRRQFLKQLARLRAQGSTATTNVSASETLVRQDRER